jgi:hypothetical protein
MVEALAFDQEAMTFLGELFDDREESETSANHIVFRNRVLRREPMDGPVFLGG